MSEIANLRELLNDLEIDRDEWRDRAERAEAEAARLREQLAEARAELTRIRAAARYYGCPRCGAKLALNDPAADEVQS